MPVMQSYSRPLNILDISCGTVEDALRLAELGHAIFATDASKIMIEKAHQKVYASKISSNKITFIQCSFNELKNHFANEKFDLVFSAFGGINCVDENEIMKLSEDFSALTNSESKLFFV